MKREYGIAACGLACCLCANTGCGGCQSDSCPGVHWCENRRCSKEKNLPGCYACPEEDCRKGMLAKVKPYGFTLFIRRYGKDKLLECLERNELNGIVYHRNGIEGDYDGFTDVEELIDFILTGTGSVNQR